MLRQIVLKSDPFSFFGQHGVQTASLVFNLDRFQWSDAAWMEERKTRYWPKQPVSIYEVHLGSWARVPEENNRYLSYIEFADRLIPYVKEMGTPILNFCRSPSIPLTVRGVTRSPAIMHPPAGLAIRTNFVISSTAATRKASESFWTGFRAIFPKTPLDWLNLTARSFTNTPIRARANIGIGARLIFNFGRSEVRNFLIANGLFWLDKYHIDGLRVDAVASMLYLDYSRKPGEWVPNIHGGRENLDAIEFMKHFNAVCYERFPGIMTIAEESTSWPGVSRPTYLGGLGFGFKWNMGWMHDFLEYMSHEPIHRRYHQGEATFSLVYAFQEHFVLVLSHDEVVHGKGSLLNKMPGDPWQKFANLRMFYAWMYAHPGKKLLFMGCDIGQWKEWNHNQSIDWHLLQYPVARWSETLGPTSQFPLQERAAFSENDDSYAGFEWIDIHDADNSILTFLRKAESGSTLLFAVNATPVPRHAYRIGVPGPGWYEEILNTDAEIYGGGNIR